MEIRPLRTEDMRRVAELKALCWPEELAGLSDCPIDTERECAFWTDWMHTARENRDVRLLYGAFEEGELLGAAFGSFVESVDAPEAGFELNGLWVFPEHRGKGISLRLIERLLREFSALGAGRMVVYNFHASPSNGYYRKWGFRVIGTERQLPEKIPVDIFQADCGDLLRRITGALARYKS